MSSIPSAACLNRCAAWSSISNGSSSSKRSMSIRSGTPSTVIQANTLPGKGRRHVQTVIEHVFDNPHESGAPLMNRQFLYIDHPLVRDFLSERERGLVDEC